MAVVAPIYIPAAEASVLSSEAAFTLRTYHGNERCSAPILNVYEAIKKYQHLGRLRGFGDRKKAGGERSRRKILENRIIAHVRIRVHITERISSWSDDARYEASPRIFCKSQSMVFGDDDVESKGTAASRLSLEQTRYS